MNGTPCATGPGWQACRSIDARNCWPTVRVSAGVARDAGVGPPGGDPARSRGVAGAGGGCLADVAVLSAQPALIGWVGVRPDGEPAGGPPQAARSLKAVRSIHRARAVSCSPVGRPKGAGDRRHQRVPGEPPPGQGARDGNPIRSARGQPASRAELLAPFHKPNVDRYTSRRNRRRQAGVALVGCCT